MSKYYVNKNTDSKGDHEVHESGCTHMPLVENRTYLGEFSSCSGAVTEAKKTYSTADGCFYCCRPCHTN
jgi:hypothetical protein